MKPRPYTASFNFIGSRCRAFKSEWLTAAVIHRGGRVLTLSLGGRASPSPRSVSRPSPACTVHQPFRSASGGFGTGMVTWTSLWSKCDPFWEPWVPGGMPAPAESRSDRASLCPELCSPAAAEVRGMLGSRSRCGIVRGPPLLAGFLPRTRGALTRYFLPLCVGKSTRGVRKTPLKGKREPRARARVF